MLFPDSAKTAIAESFYDKTVEILAKQETLDDEGGVVKSGLTVKSTFRGNVRFNALGVVQQELGLVEDIDIAISCSPSIDVKIDDLLQYNGKRYVVTDVLPFDSHLLITGKKWQAQ